MAGVRSLILLLLAAAAAGAAAHADEPRFAAFQPVDPETDGGFALTLADLDGDGDLDLVVGRGGHYPAPNAVYRNDGRGDFGPAEPFGTAASTFTLAHADIDGDGRLEVLVGNALANTSQIFTAGADGRLELRDALGAQGVETRWLGVADLDADGDRDIVMLTKGSAQYAYLTARNVVLLNDGQGRFGRERPLGSASEFSIDGALGDLDADGDVDVVVANHRSTRSRVHRNDGTGSFDEGYGLGPKRLDNRAIALGDLDGDSDLDVVLGHWQGENLVLLNDSQASFRTSTSRFGAKDAATRDLALADLDADGDLDVVEAAVGQQDFVHWNDGSGHFPTSTPLGSTTSETWAVAVSDVDGDGAPDVAVARANEPSGIYRNQSKRRP